MARGLSADVLHFRDICVLQERALDDFNNRDYNRLYGKLQRITEGLKSQDPDGRRALSALFEDPSPQVRLMAAIHALVHYPTEARRVLTVISDRLEYPQAADARGMLTALQEGRYIPS